MYDWVIVLYDIHFPDFPGTNISRKNMFIHVSKHFIEKTIILNIQDFVINC